MGARSSTTVAVEIAYRKVGTTAWLSPPLGAEARESPPDPLPPNPDPYGSGGTFQPPWWEDNQPPMNSPPNTAPPSGTVTFTQDRHTPIRHGARWRVEERAQYEVRIRTDDCRLNFRNGVRRGVLVGTPHDHGPGPDHYAGSVGSDRNQNQGHGSAPRGSAADQRRRQVDRSGLGLSDQYVDRAGIL